MVLPRCIFCIWYRLTPTPFTLISIGHLTTIPLLIPEEHSIMELLMQPTLVMRLDLVVTSYQDSVSGTSRFTSDVLLLMMISKTIALRSKIILSVFAPIGLLIHSRTNNWATWDWKLCKTKNTEGPWKLLTTIKEELLLTLREKHGKTVLRASWDQTQCGLMTGMWMSTNQKSIKQSRDCEQEAMQRVITATRAFISNCTTEYTKEHQKAFLCIREWMICEMVKLTFGNRFIEK